MIHLWYNRIANTLVYTPCTCALWVQVWKTLAEAQAPGPLPRATAERLKDLLRDKPRAAAHIHDGDGLDTIAAQLAGGAAPDAALLDWTLKLEGGMTICDRCPGLGAAPVHLAAANGSLAAVKALYREAPDCLALRDAGGVTCCLCYPHEVLPVFLLSVR